MTNLRTLDFSTFVCPRIRKEGSAKKARLLKMACIVFAFCIAMAIASPAQTFNSLVIFNGTDGGTPLGTLLQGTDGELYGTTEFAGTCGNGAAGGTAFKITTSGAMTVLHNFCQDAQGYDQVAGLAQASNGIFYGSNTAGGGGAAGTVFEITSKGTLTTLLSFNVANGQNPSFSLIQGTDGNLYGTTEGPYGNGGGPNGTVFEMSLAGKLTTLHSFSGADGAGIGSIIQGTNGSFYGVAASGGAFSAGTMFSITLAESLTPLSSSCSQPNCVGVGTSTLTTLYNFCSQPNCIDGIAPYGLVLSKDGNFYGTAFAGGNANAGTFFRITPSGEFTTIYSFCSAGSCSDGQYPAQIIQGSDGNFYGTTALGGAYGYGTIFKLAPSGVLTTLHSFCANTGCPDGANPTELIQGTNGTFYGTASSGGATSYPCDDAINGGTAPGCGTIFSLSTGLGPFVQPRLTMGKVDSNIILLGDNLTGTTAVSFGGTAATFKVVSDTEIMAKVPNGATTGPIQVTTPGAAFNSNGSFWVTPQIKSISPPSGPAGTAVKITGVSLTQTSGVTFDGVAATQFTVNSDTEVTATVPPGALAGKITITTAGGTASSGASFNLTNSLQTPK
jgi:uncharacterized repeat protein (TIGR03803 family)